MENPHPATILKCSATELENAVIWLLRYKPTTYTRKVIRRAASRIYGHSVRSKRYPVPNYLHTCLGTYGFTKREAFKFQDLCKDAYDGRVLTVKQCQYLSGKLIKNYITQLTMYSDVNKLRKLLEKYRAQK